MGKQTVVHSHHGILFRDLKNELLSHEEDMEETLIHFTQ